MFLKTIYWESGNIRYHSNHSNNLYIQANVNSTTSNVTNIDDAYDYDSMTSASGKWTIPSACPVVYDDTGAKFGTASSYSRVQLINSLSANYSVEFTLVDWNRTTSGQAVIIYQYTNGTSTPNQALLEGGNNNGRLEAVGNVINHEILKNAVYRINYTTSTISVYENDVLLASGNNNIGFPTKFEFHIGTDGNRWIKLKDVKVRKL